MPISEVYNMDCMEYMKELPDKYFDLAVVDPPYGITRFSRAAGKSRFAISPMMQNSGLLWDKRPSKLYFDTLYRVSKNQIIFGANNFTEHIPNSEYFLIWDKEQSVPNFSSAEYAYVSLGLKKPAKIFRFSVHKNNSSQKIHPTQKPIELYAWIFKHYAKEGDKILDTHLGSGSSRIAAYKLGLDFYATEIEKDYFEAQEKRFRRECFGEIETKQGVVIQTNLFDM